MADRLHQMQSQAEVLKYARRTRDKYDEVYEDLKKTLGLQGCTELCQRVFVAHSSVRENKHLSLNAEDTKQILFLAILRMLDMMIELGEADMQRTSEQN